MWRRDVLEGERENAYLPAHPKFPPYGKWRGGYFDWASGAVSGAAWPSAHRGDDSASRGHRRPYSQATRGGTARDGLALWHGRRSHTCGVRGGGIGWLGTGTTSAVSVSRHPDICHLSCWLTSHRARRVRGWPGRV